MLNSKNSSLYRTLISLLALVFFLFLKTPALAATFTFSGAPATISDNESFSVNVTLSIGSSAGKSYYIRAVFSHPDSPSSYFGYIKNNAGNWYNGTPSIDKTQYYKVTMDENNQWSGTIETKPDPESSAYKGVGTYNFKLGRYTETGSTVTWCTSESTPCALASISITAVASPTPTSIPEPTPTSLPVNTPTSVKTPTSAKTPTPTLTVASTPTSTPPSTKKATAGAVLAESVASEASIAINLLPLETPSPSPTQVAVAAAALKVPQLTFVIGGILVVISGIIFAWKKYMSVRAPMTQED